ncbi:MAG: AraC family transcriptional regulator [Acholeplasmatales bacterium]|nr:AraC family transcriptional regulator [Acholeplasmatales bacterium]
MFVANEIVEFEFEHIKFSLSDFRLQTLTLPYPLHYHGKNTLEIHFVKNGAGQVMLEDKTYDVSSNFFYIVGSFITHGQVPDKVKGMEKYSIYFTIDTSMASLELQELLRGPAAVFMDKYDCASIFERILDEFSTKNIGYKQLIVSYLEELLIKIVRAHSMLSRENRNQDSVSNTHFELEKIFLNEFKTITLTDMAHRLSFSERELQKYFKKNYSKTFNELKLEARMQYAANQLIFTDKPISVISNDTGYSSTEHFSYAFKQYHDLTPLKYRKANKRD